VGQVRHRKPSHSAVKRRTKESVRSQNERRGESKGHFKFKELVPVAQNGQKRKTSENDKEVTTYPRVMREHLVYADLNELLLLKGELHIFQVSWGREKLKNFGSG